MDKDDKDYNLELDDMKKVMENKHGRRMLNQLLNTCGVFRISYNATLNESYTFFNEGQRNVGLQLIAKLQDASPALFSRMVEEKNIEFK